MSRLSVTTTADWTSAERRPFVPELVRTLRYARERGYAGWHDADGERAWLGTSLSIAGRGVDTVLGTLRRLVPDGVLRTLGSTPHRSTTGTALFAVSTRNVQFLANAGAVEDDNWYAEHRGLVDELRETARRDGPGVCWDHSHPVRRADGSVVGPTDPSVRATAQATRAMLSAGDPGRGDVDVVDGAIEFVEEGLDYRETTGGAIVNAPPGRPDALCPVTAARTARLLLDCYAYDGSVRHREMATALLDHVAGMRHANGLWSCYRPGMRRRSVYGFENGVVVEAFLRHHEVTETERFSSVLEKALMTYQTVLFDRDGAPAHDHRSSYPRDVRTSAQGVLVFTYAGMFDVAERLVDWALDHLYSDEGTFYRCRRRFRTDRTTLMDCCQARMGHAISEYLRVACLHLRGQVHAGRQLPVGHDRAREWGYF